MFKKILALLFLVVCAVVFLAMREGDTFVVQRQILIQAYPDKIYNLIDDFHHWEQWSPWDKKDAAMKKTFSGPESGPGAVYVWQGNSQVGQGKMTITKALPPYQLDIQLDFIEPMQTQNQVVFLLQPQGRSTLVTWKMTGKNTSLTKIMHVFMDMDKMVGSDFDTGLQTLKEQVEKQQLRHLPLPNSPSSESMHE